MPTPLLLDDCRRDAASDALAEWVDQTKVKWRQEDKKHHAIWNRSFHVPALSDKHKCAFRWAVRVRKQHEPTRRMIRVFRWLHRPRVGNLATRLFYAEADKWKNDTMHWSSITKVISHPSYLRIIGLGRKFQEGEIEKLILHELENEPYHWFDALVAITGENPVNQNDDFDEAVNAWLEWGRQKGIIENNNSRRA